MKQKTSSFDYRVLDMVSLWFRRTCKVHYPTIDERAACKEGILIGYRMACRDAKAKAKQKTIKNMGE